MSIELTDAEIRRRIKEPKVLPADFRQKLQRRQARGFGHKRARLRVRGTNGGRFTIMLRENVINPFDFSAILGYQLPETMRLFRLLRYNGTGHRHTNRIEKETFRGFHIHRATERYQERGAKEDAFAERANSFNSLESAINCLLHESGCTVADDPDQRLLFSGESGDTA